MKNLIEKALKLRAEISDYEIMTIDKNSFEVYYVHNKVETIRNTNGISYQAIIHVPHDGKLGVTSCLFNPSMNEEEVKEEINKSIENAKKIFNEFYSFPEKEVSSLVIHSNIDDYSNDELVDKIAKCFFEMEDDNHSINALEIFINRKKVSIINSKGLDKVETTSSVFIESIPTYTHGLDSVELYKAYTLNVIDFDKLKENVKDSLNDVKARYEAKNPTAKISANVIFRPEEIGEIFNAIMHELTYPGEYMKTASYHIGDNLQKNLVENPFTLEATNIQGGTILSSFDHFGSAFVPTTIIKDGICVSTFGNTQYAQMINKPCTGSLPFMRLSGGKVLVEELKKEPYLECASMSGIQVSVASNYIGGEIRLGYYYDGQKITPVSGISISGKLDEFLSSLVLSNDEIILNDYEGPSRILAKHFEII